VCSCVPTAKPYPCAPNVLCVITILPRWTLQLLVVVTAQVRMGANNNRQILRLLPLVTDTIHMLVTRSNGGVFVSPAVMTH
jgi:hypothetical protein